MSIFKWRYSLVPEEEQDRKQGRVLDTIAPRLTIPMAKQANYKRTFTNTRYLNKITTMGLQLLVGIGIYIHFRQFFSGIQASHKTLGTKVYTPL